MEILCLESCWSHVCDLCFESVCVIDPEFDSTQILIRLDDFSFNIDFNSVLMIHQRGKIKIVLLINLEVRHSNVHIWFMDRSHQSLKFTLTFYKIF